jgi:hypothetical protein
MSRGPGHAQRAVLAAFEGNPSRSFSAGDLARLAYPDAPAIERRHRVAVIRAADAASWRLDWTALRSKGREPGLVYFRNGDAQGVAEAQARVAAV